MKRILLLLLVFCCGTTVNYSQTLDASNAPANSGGGGFAVSPSENVGQSFLAGLTGPLSQVNVYFQNFSFTAGDFILTIYSGDGYGGTVLGTQTFTLASAPPEGEYVIPISSTINVTAGNMYTMRLDGITGTGNFLAPSSNPYGNGVLYYSNGFSFNSYDLWFKTFVTLPNSATHLNFGGSNDYVNCGNNPSLQITGNAITLEAYVKFNTFGTDHWLGNIINKAAPNSNGYMLRAGGNGAVNFVVANSGWYELTTANNAITLNTWFHIAGVYNGSTLKIYIDGVEVASTNTAIGSIGNSVSNLNLGRDPQDIIRGLDASLEEVRIWNVARTAEQINGSKNCELQGTETGLVAYYKFNQGNDAADNTAITSLLDATANANNGTLVNFTKTGTTSNFLSGSPVTTGSIIPSEATVTSPVTYSQGDTATALSATVGANGSGLSWYTTATGGTGATTAPTPSTATVGSTSYWVSSTNANGCESARTEIVVNVIAPATHLNFDGVNDRINCGNSPSVQITGSNITLEAMIRLNSFASFPNDGNIINKEQNSPDNGYMLRVGGSGIVNFTIGNGSWNEINSPVNAVQLATWHHVVGTYDGITMKIYVDGVMVTSQPSTMSIGNSTSDLFIGDWPNGGRNLDGDIDEVRIWNRALPIAEIQNNMGCELPSPSTQNGLVAYYQFNQGTDAADNTAITTLTDASGNANNGTLVNFTKTGTTSNFLAGSPIVTGTNCAVLSNESFEVANNIKMYPNPTYNFVTVEVNKLTNVKLQVLDITGKVLMNQSLKTNSNSIDVQQLPTGIYLFKLSSSEGTITSKIVKN